MKKNKLFLCALASGMLTLAGCSDSTDLGQAGGNGANWNADGTGYISLAINMPQTSNGGSRTSDATGSNNDQFNDGTPREYAVDDAILCLFTSENANAAESAYTFAAAYNLPLQFNNKDNSNQITSTAQITKKITSISGNIKALVILNPSSAKIECPNPVDLNDASSNTLKVDNANFTGSFEDFCKKTASVNTDLSKGKFMMINAPLSNLQSTSKGLSPADTELNIKTLADVDATKIQATAKDATASPAAEIYVERSVAKVTMTTAEFKNEIKATTSGAPKITCSILGYVLDNTNATTYIVRNTQEYDSWYKLTSQGVTSIDKFRFVGNSRIADNSRLYRTYFAKDVNYAGEEGAAKLTTSTETDRVWSETSASLYCMENTFDVEHQKHENTTRAILKVKYEVEGVNSEETTKSEDLYMYNNDPKTLCIYDKDATEGTLLHRIKTLLESREEINTLPLATGATSPLTVDQLNIVPSTDGYVKLTGFVVNNVEGGPITVNESATGTAADLYKLINKLGLDNIAKYVKGEGYYTVLIKHFGDELTPWNTTEKETYTPTAGAPYYAANANGTFGDATETANNNYLGRYGVLRNNWYDLNVTGVNRIGTPNIPAPGKEWDDDMESYIAVKINILSWAIRKQGVVLQ